jgi:hypothetical protein
VSGFRYTSQLREIWGPNCLSASDRSTVTLNGRNYTVHKDTIPAWEAWERIRSRHGYSLDSSQTGTQNCRQITGGSGLSLHSFGIALDVNWHRNGYSSTFVSDLPSAMVREILDLRAGGHRLFKWGGDWDDDPSTAHSKYDAMHFEINATPEEIRAGITGDQGEDVMSPEQEAHFNQRISELFVRIGEADRDDDDAPVTLQDKLNKATSAIGRIETFLDEKYPDDYPERPKDR